MTTDTNMTLEELRVFSQMSEKCHFIEIDGKHYTCINGIALPYNIAVVIMISIMSGLDSSRFLNPIKIINMIKQLNPNNITIKLSYIDNIFRNTIKNWEKSQFNELIPINLSKLQDLL